MDLPDPDADAAEAKAAKEQAAKDAHAKDLAEGAKYKELEFVITEVKCIEATGGALEGTDEIALGGIYIGATGHVEKVKQFKVKEGFDSDSDHNVKKYKNGKRFATFELHHDAPWPHEFTVSLAMAELDSGGFGDFLLQLWNKVKVIVLDALADLGGTIAGAASLSWIPGIGTLIGAAIGAFIGWLVGLFHNDDDIVGHKTRHLRLHHATKSYYEKKDVLGHGKVITIDFKDCGHYQLTGAWRLVKP
jgi:hypothetical protein